MSETKNPTAKFDAWARKMGMKPIMRQEVAVVVDGCKYTTDLLIADSGTTIIVKDSMSPPSSDGTEIVYRTGFCIFRDGAWVGKWNDYDPAEFAFYTLDGAQQRRVQECLNYGEAFLVETARARLYDGRTAYLN